MIQRESLNIGVHEEIRGANFNGILYVTGGQHYNVDMIKVILERIEEDVQVILEGDKRQIDKSMQKEQITALTQCWKFSKVPATWDMSS